MNNNSKTKTTNGVSHPKNLDGYVQLLSSPTIFEMDLVGKNLQMNGIDALWFYPENIEHQDELPLLFVRTEQKENALNILTSLDIIDFTTLNRNDK